MIQGCMPSIQEILSKVQTHTNMNYKYCYYENRFFYNEDGITLRTTPYVTDSSREQKYFETDILLKKKYEFAKCVHNKYVEKMKENNDTMPYNLNLGIDNPFNLFGHTSSTYNAITSLNSIAELYKAETIDESDEGLIVTTTKQPKGSILPYNLLDILSKIKDYKIYNGKALVVWFTDGSFTKAVVSNGEEFDFYTGLMVCLFKKYLGENGSKKFNKMMEVAMKKLGDIDKNKEKQADEKALAEKKRRKADMKRKAKALKKKEEAIDIQKQGYIRAMQELGEDDRK